MQSTPPSVDPGSRGTAEERQRRCRGIREANGWRANISNTLQARRLARPPSRTCRFSRFGARVLVLV